MRLVMLILMMPLVIFFTGLLWFSSLWSRHQEDRSEVREMEWKEVAHEG